MAECPEIHSIAAQSQCKLQETKDKMTSLTDDIVRKLLEKHQAEVRSHLSPRVLVKVSVFLLRDGDPLDQWFPNFFSSRPLGS